MILVRLEFKRSFEWWQNKDSDKKDEGPWRWRQEQGEQPD